MTKELAASRRSIVKGLAGTIGAAALAPAVALAQQPSAATATPPSVITNPPRQWGRGAPPEFYPDPDIVVIDPSFRQYLLGITAIHRVGTGFLWAEGPAWSSEGQVPSSSATFRATHSIAFCGTTGG